MWIDEDPTGEGKICVHGHIHGIYSGGGEYKVPGTRTIGLSNIIDTGCGCAEEGYLTCVDLSTMWCHNSIKGEA